MLDEWEYNIPLVGLRGVVPLGLRLRDLREVHKDKQMKVCPRMCSTINSGRPMDGLHKMWMDETWLMKRQ